MDEELKKLIDDYVKEIEKREDDIRSLKNGIHHIISKAKKEMEDAAADLEEKFQSNTITEGEYLESIKKEKVRITSEVKSKLENFVQETARKSDSRQETKAAEGARIEELRKSLGV